MVAALWLLAAPQAQASIADTVARIADVVVWARPAYKEVIQPQRLEGEQLRRLNALSVADALRYFSGMQVKDYGGVGGIKTINVRSMGSEHIGISYDGMELGNAQNGQIDLGQFSLDNVEAVSVYNGQRSAIFQSASDYAHASTVYIRTRIPEFTGGRRRNLMARLRYGQGNTLNFSSLWEERLSSHTALSLSLSSLTSNGRYRFRYNRVTPGGTTAWDTTAVRHNGDIQAFRAEANLYGKTQRGSWAAKAYTYVSGRGIPGAIVNNVWRRGERQSDLNSFVQAQWQKSLTNHFSTRFMAKYAYYRTHYVNRDSTVLPVDNRYYQQEVYLSTANVYDLLPFWSVSASYDVHWNKLNASTWNFAYPTRWSQLLSVATVLNRSTNPLPSYATVLSAGNLKLQGSVVAQFVADHLRRGGTSAHLSKLMPAIYLSYMLPGPHGIELRAFAKRSFRMPTFNDLYYTDAGNALLKPEEANQYDAGFTWQITRKGSTADVSVRADAYYNTISNKIIAYPKGQQFRWTMLNLGRVHITGVDAEATARIMPARNWLLLSRVCYTFQRAIDVTSPSDVYYRDQIPYVPHHSVTATASVDYRQWYANYSFIYTGCRYNEQQNIRRNYMQPWYTHDMALGLQTRLHRVKCRLQLEINNVLNQHYDVILNYPMPGRNAAASVTLNF